MKFLYLLLSASVAYFNRINAKGCKAKLDVMFALDTTASMRGDVETIRADLPALLEALNINYPELQAGLVHFSDELTYCLLSPLWNYGVALMLPLTKDVESVRRGLRNYNADNGDAFLPEDSFGGILVAARHESVYWRSLDDPEIRRLIVVITDQVFRYPGDHERVCSKGDVLKPNDMDGDYNNEVEDYPTDEAIAKILKDDSIGVIFMTTEKAAFTYEQFLSEFDLNGAVLKYRSSHMDFAGAVSDTLEKVACGVLECHDKVYFTVADDTSTTSTTTSSTTTGSTTTSSATSSATSTSGANGSYTPTVLIVSAGATALIAAAAVGAIVHRKVKERASEVFMEGEFATSGSLAGQALDISASVEQDAFS